MLKKNKILFIWIPKTAGSSMFNIFKKYGCQKLKYPKYYLNFNNEGFVTFDHINLKSLIQRGFVTLDYFKDAFKFAFVRNPWDRLVSLYAYNKRMNKKRFGNFENFVRYIEKKFHNKDRLFSKFIDNLYEPFLHRYSYFHEKKKYQFKRVYLVIERFLNKYNIYNELEPSGLYNRLGMSQANPQSDWLFDDNGNLLVNFIGKYENLEKDFQKLSKILGIEENLPHVNVSKHLDYKLYYNEKTKKIVQRIYQEDINNFNYRF